MYVSTNINLLVLRSSDIEKLKNFYEKLLEVKFESHTDHGPLHYGALIGSVLLELYSTKKELLQLDSPGFSVSGLENVIARVEPKYVHKQSYDSDFGRMAILKDPDNRLVFLVESEK